MFNVLAKEKLTPVMTVLRVEAPAIARMDDGHRMCRDEAWGTRLNPLIPVITKGLQTTRHGTVVANEETGKTSFSIPLFKSSVLAAFDELDN